MAGLAALMLLVATQAYAAVNGNIDMVDANSRLIAGWACTVGNSSPVAVEVWSGDSTTDSGARQLGIYNADQPSEPGVASACQSTGQNHRFRIGITSEMIAGAGGRPVYVYVIGKSGGALGGSGRWTLPATGDYPYVETITFIHTDRLGSTLMESDALGNVSQQADYAPFGANLTNPKEAPGYTGHYEDPTTGLTYMQSRYYDSAVGRFISVDPLPAVPGDISLFNRYAYVGNRPLNFVDPDGRAAQGADKKDKEKAKDLEGFVVTAANGGGGAGAMGGVGGGGSAGGAVSVRTEETMFVPAFLARAIPTAIRGPLVLSRPAASLARVALRSPYLLWFVDANGFHDWIYGRQGCYGALVCQGVTAPHYPGVYANEEALPEESDLTKVKERDGNAVAQDAGYIDAHDAKKGRGEGGVDIYKDKETGRFWLWNGVPGADKEQL